MIELVENYNFFDKLTHGPIVPLYRLLRALARTLRVGRNVTLFRACSRCSSIYNTLSRKKKLFNFEISLKISAAFRSTIRP